MPSGEGQSGPQSFLAGSSEVTLGAGAALSRGQHPGTRSSGDHVPAPHGPDRRGRVAPLGARPARVADDPVRVDNRLEGDRSSVEQAEIVFGGADQLFDLTSYTRHVGRDTTGNLLSKGALLDKARGFMKGMITIERSAVGTDSYLGEFGMNLSQRRAIRRHPEPRDRPARLPTGGPRQLGRSRSTRPSSSTSRAAASRPTRPASSSSSASWSRSWPACRWPTPRTGCDPCSRRSGTPAPGVPPPTLPREAHRSPGRGRGPRGHDEDGVRGRHGPGPRHQLERRVVCDAGRLQPRVLRARQGLPDRRAR